jgi:hypothetical protein
VHIPLIKIFEPNIYERVNIEPKTKDFDHREVKWRRLKEELIYLRTGSELESEQELESDVKERGHGHSLVRVAWRS